MRFYSKIKKNVKTFLTSMASAARGKLIVLNIKRHTHTHAVIQNRERHEILLS